MQRWQGISKALKGHSFPVQVPTRSYKDEHVDPPQQILWGLEALFGFWLSNTAYDLHKCVLCLELELVVMEEP